MQQTFFRDGFPYPRQPAAVVPSAPGTVVGAADELPAALVVRVAVALPLQAEPRRVLGWRKSRYDVRTCGAWWWKG